MNQQSMQSVASVNEINNEELDYYLNVLSSSFKLSNDYKNTINLLEDMFNVTVSLEQLEEYYSLDVSVIEEDLRLQFKHLNLI